jgi:hypothetical protein
VITAVLFALVLQAQDPVRVRVQLTAPEVGVGETTVLRVDVVTPGSRAQIEPLPGLPPGIELAGTRDFDQRQFAVPGGGRRYVTREHVLRADAPGRFRIPAVEVVVDGRRYATETLLLTVTGSAAPDPGRRGVARDGVVLRAWLDADTVYVGQQVTLHVEAVFSQEARLRLRRAPEYEPPAPAGFWVHDIADGRAPVTRGTRGDVYETQTFRRAFFPISPGRYEIPPARLFYEMRRGILQAPETFTIATDPLPVVVLPVPQEGRPDTFSGAVGRFTVSGTLEPPELAAGDAAVLTIEVHGTGNIKAVPPPPLPELPGVEVFPPTEAAEVEVVDRVVGGQKRFSWVLIPRESGRIPVPEIPYVAFDPHTGEFRSAFLQLPDLQVERGSVALDAGSPAALRYLKTRTGAGRGLEWVRSPWFATAQLLPLVLLGGAFLRRQERRRGGAPSPRELRRRRRAGIRELSARAAADDPELLARAEAFATGWIADRLDISPRAVARPESLIGAGASAETARHLLGVLERIAAARFAPVRPDTVTRHDLVEALARTLERLDREAPRRRRRPTAPLAALLALALTPALTVGQGTTGLPPFRTGIQHFDAGRYQQAVAAFEIHVGDRPDDAAGWYNLGTAHFRAGDAGRATWAWLQAVRLHPRDPDARHNLRISGVPPELVRRVTPALPLRTEEFLLLAAAFWFAAAWAGARWLLAGGRATGGAATVAALLALGLALGSWQASRATPTLVVVEATVLRAGPNLQAEDLARLDAGTGLVPVDRRPPWLRARTLSGLEGWLEDRAAAPVR